MCRMEKLLNKQEVAETFGVTVKAIDKWVCEKKIPYLKLSQKCVRFIPSEIRSYINHHRVKPDAKTGVAAPIGRPRGSSGKTV